MMHDFIKRNVSNENLQKYFSTVTKGNEIKIKVFQNAVEEMP